MKQWHCNECGRAWTSSDEIAAHFHSCPKQLRRPVDIEAFEYPSLEERWHAIFHTVGGGYRPPTIEEARAETGDQGRRKPGSGRK